MKRLTLGLFLTVGMVGMSFANVITPEEEVLLTAEKAVAECSVNVSVNNEAVNEGLPVILARKTCLNVYVTRWYDCDGSFNSIINSQTSTDCSAGGEVNYFIDRVDGCPQG